MSLLLDFPQAGKLGKYPRPEGIVWVPSVSSGMLISV